MLIVTHLTRVSQPEANRPVFLPAPETLQQTQVNQQRYLTACNYTLQGYGPLHCNGKWCYINAKMHFSKAYFKWQSHCDCHLLVEQNHFSEHAEALLVTHKKMIVKTAMPLAEHNRTGK